MDGIVDISFNLSTSEFSVFNLANTPLLLSSVIVKESIMFFTKSDKSLDISKDSEGEIRVKFFFKYFFK